MLNWIYKPSIVKLVLNLWPPFWGAGIKIIEISSDFRYVRMGLTFRWWNKNANRSQYGGSIFSMTDPVYSLMLMGILGEKYFVWDKQASIDFIKPGRGKVYADFIITDELLDEIAKQTANGGKYLPVIPVYIEDESGDVVAKVMRTLYIRKKQRK